MIDIRQNQDGTSLLVSGDTIALSYSEGTVLSLAKNTVAMILEEESDMVIFRNAANYEVLFQGLIDEITIDGNSVTRDTIVDVFSSFANSSTGGGGGSSDYDDSQLKRDIQNLKDTKADKSDLEAYQTKQQAQADKTLIEGEINDLRASIDDIDIPDVSGLATKDELKDYETIEEHNKAVSELNSHISEVEEKQSQDLAKITELQGKLNNVNEVQEKLVSGTNLKTINNQSLLGSGNIEIQGGMTPDQEQELNQLRSDIEQALGEIAEVDTEVEKIQDSLGNYVTKDEFNTKQDTLISGTNLKTINGESLLGSGNIEIESGGLTPEQDEELKSLRNDVEQALGEIAELGADKQNKLSGNYLVKFEQNGGQVDFTQRGFDGLSESTKSISFKTINSQSILGQGNIKIEGGSGTDSPFEVSGTGVRRVGNTDKVGRDAFAESTTATASGDYSHSEGYSTTASSYYSHAENNNTTANGNASHAEGNYTGALGDYSHSEGSFTTASGEASHAEGLNTTASGKYSHVEGKYTTSENESEHASGQYNVSTTGWTGPDWNGSNGQTLFTVGNGIGNSHKHNAFEIRQNGDIYIPDTSAEGEYYEKPMIYLQDALKKSGGGGNANIVTITQQAYEELTTKDPNTLYAISDADPIEFKTINGESILGDGDITIESGSDSPFEVSGSGVRRVGSTTTVGNNAFAENTTVTASGNYAHAEGQGSESSGYNSHTEGSYTTARNFAEHASGRYNKSTLDSKSSFTGSDFATLFSIGNGATRATEHNAFEIKQNGDIYIPDTSAEGYYYQKPMIKLQDALRNTDIYEPTTYKINYQFFYSTNINKYGIVYSTTSTSILPENLKNIKLGDIVQDNDGLSAVITSCRKYSSDYTIYEGVCSQTANRNRLPLTTTSTINYAPLHVEILVPNTSSYTLTLVAYATFIKGTGETFSAGQPVKSYTLTEAAYEELAKKTDLPDTASFATQEYVDSQIGDINNILENILG